MVNVKRQSSRASRPRDDRLYVAVYTVRGEDTTRIISVRATTNTEIEAMSSKAVSRGKIRRNTSAQDGRIKAGIKADPDTRELTAKDFAEAVPFAEMMKRRRGRPKAAKHKVPVTVRLEPDVVEFFRGSGPGWQTRMNDTLARYVARQRQSR